MAGSSFQQPHARQSTTSPAGTAHVERRRRLSSLNFREHPVAVVLVLLGMLALTVLPPLLIVPRGTFELLATAVLTLLACVLAAIVLYEILWH